MQNMRLYIFTGFGLFPTEQNLFYLQKPTLMCMKNNEQIFKKKDKKKTEYMGNKVIKEKIL